MVMHPVGWKFVINKIPPGKDETLRTMRGGWLRNGNRLVALYRKQRVKNV